jgi:hypothetical protein
MKTYKILAKINHYGTVCSRHDGEIGTDYKQENIINVMQEFIMEVENELYDSFYLNGQNYTIIKKEEIIKGI